MKKTSLFIRAALIFILTAVSIACATEKGNFLWKVTGKGSQAYLLGSIHVVPDGIYPLSSKIEKAFESSNYLVVEADVNNIDQNKVQALTMQKGLFMDGNDLSKVLDNKTYMRLEQALDSIKMLNIVQVRMMRPWLAALTLPQLMIMKMGYKLDNGIDMHFLKAAAADNKKILELESAEFQIELISGFPEELQIKFLESALDETETFKEKYESMISAWKKDDVKDMDRIINTEMKSRPELKPLYDKLINERNISMAKKIDGWLKKDNKETYFVVVGAGHITGTEGIAELLKKKGYKVEKL